MRSLHYIYKTSILFLFILSFAACSGEDDSNTLEEKDFNLERLSFALSRGLPMADLTDINATHQELIYDWHLVIVDNKGKVEAIFDRSKFNTATSVPFEEEEVSAINSQYKEGVDFVIKEGDKYIYAFANMDIPTEMNEVGKHIAHETAMALTATVNGNGFTISDANHIPMSNVIMVKLTNESNQKVDIPLFRMLSKVKFAFRTYTKTNITVQKIVMNHVNQNTPNNIFLFSSLNDKEQPLLPATASSGSFVFDNLNLLVSKEAQEPEYTFYLNESKQPESETIGFTLTTKRDDRESTEQRYALTIAQGLRRNDYLRIPVTLTDYTFLPRIDFYPPIGGYGNAVVTSEPGEVFFAKLNSGGQFVLRPQIYNAATNTPIPDNDTNLIITTTVVSGDNILSIPLTYNTIDRWYDATVDGSKKGQILFTLSYRVSGEEDYNVTLERKIYVIKE